MSGRRPRGAQFSVGHILGDPFALATISISILGWLIALVGSVITTIHGAQFNKFYWWALAYMLCCIVGVTVVVLSGTGEQYSVAVVGFLAVAVTYDTFAVSSVVFSNDGAQEAAAAGYILLSIVSLLWIGYFGSSPQAKHRGYVDSFALNKEQRMSMRGSRPISANNPYDTRGNTSGSAPNQAMYTSAQMGGMESSNNRTGFGGSGAMGAGPNGSQPRFGGGAAPMGGSAPRSPPAGMGAASGGGMNGSMNGGMGGGMGGGMSGASAGPQMGAPMGAAPMGSSSQDMAAAGLGAAPPSGAGGDNEQYPYRAKAIYSYEANPDDANEISFTKHEILEVSDVSGRWWQAKKENGETGIAPSNYLILL